MNNEKQIGTGLMMYAQDYDETLPGNSLQAIGAGQLLGWNAPYNPGGTPASNNWRCVPRDLQPYVKNLSIFVCPVTIDRGDDKNPANRSIGYGNATTDPNGGNSSYLFNGITESRPLTDIKEPSNIIFLHEEYEYQRQTQSKPYLVIDSNANPVLTAAGEKQYKGCDWSSYDNIHPQSDLFTGKQTQGANLLFCDGHSKFRMKTSIIINEFGCNSTEVMGTGSTITRGNTAYTGTF